MPPRSHHGSAPGLQHARKNSSHSSIDFMPVISETEEAHTASRMEPRIPQKSARRFSAANPLARGLPPPYVPTLHHSPSPPSYKEEHWKLAERVKKQQQSRTRCHGWNRRRCLCVLVVMVAVLGVMGVGLGIGLAVGLKKTSERHTSSDAETEGPAPVFPAGSYTFNTTLQNAATSCTSNPSTWRCYPYSTGQPASFFWVITEVNASSYTISSTDNPFAPSFSNLTLTMYDADTPNERLIFSFDMDKTVVPGDALTADNSAAKCTFKETSFEATLWTNKGGNPAEKTSGVNFEDWPGDVEVVQEKHAAKGAQTCVDGQGDDVGNVQVGVGQCGCRYASWDDE